MSKWLINRYQEIYKTGYLPFLGIVSIELTYKCNLYCSMCFYNNTTVPELRLSHFIDFLKKIPTLKEVHLTAREPTVKPGFFMLTEYLANKNVPLVLLTNGLLINKDNYSKLTYNKNNIIMLSLDGSRETHDKIRGLSGCFNKVVESIKFLKDKCSLRIVSVISENNINKLWQMPEIVRNIGYNQIIFEYERKYTEKVIEESKITISEKMGFSCLKLNKDTKPTYSFKKLSENIKKLEKTADKCNVNISFMPQYFKERMSDIYCRQMRKKNKLICRYLDKPRIDPEGNIIHCFAYRKSFGNIKTDDLLSVWNSKQYKRFRIRLLRENLMPICETCWGALPVDKK